MSNQYQAHQIEFLGTRLGLEDPTLEEYANKLEEQLATAGGSATLKQSVVIFLDSNRTDSYTEEGTIANPFKTFNAAWAYVVATYGSAAERITLQFASGDYYVDTANSGANWTNTFTDGANSCSLHLQGTSNRTTNIICTGNYFIFSGKRAELSFSDIRFVGANIGMLETGTIGSLNLQFSNCIFYYSVQFLWNSLFSDLCENFFYNCEFIANSASQLNAMFRNGTKLYSCTFKNTFSSLRGYVAMFGCLHRTSGITLYNSDNGVASRFVIVGNYIEAFSLSIDAGYPSVRATISADLQSTYYLPSYGTWSVAQQIAYAISIPYSRNIKAEAVDDLTTCDLQAMLAKIYAKAKSPTISSIAASVVTTTTIDDLPASEVQTTLASIYSRAKVNLAEYTTKSAAYTFLASDANKAVSLTGSTAYTFTVPTNATAAIPLYSSIVVVQEGTGQLTIAAASGVTILTEVGLKLNAQYAMATLYKIGTDRWLLSGSLKA